MQTSKEHDSRFTYFFWLYLLYYSTLASIVLSYLDLKVYLPEALSSDSFEDAGIQGTNVGADCVYLSSSQSVSRHAEIPHNHCFTLQHTNTNILFHLHTNSYSKTRNQRNASPVPKGVRGFFFSFWVLKCNLCPPSFMWICLLYQLWPLEIISKLEHSIVEAKRGRRLRVKQQANKQTCVIYAFHTKSRIGRTQ